VADEVVSLEGSALEFRALADFARGQALEGLGRTREAEDSYRQARDAIQQLQQTLALEHRDTFINRSDIQAVLQ
ncbi:MAG: hypothetical protein V3U28_03835, partial [Candidatus Acidoferrales bacterium]